jgi:tetratricopeptide (TPR) repeat protein
MLLPLSAWADEDRKNATLNRGLSSDEPYSYSLMNKAQTAENRLDLTNEAVKLSPDVPALYSKLAWTTLPNVVESLNLYIKCIDAYKKNFWWQMSLAGFLFVAILSSLILALAIIALITFFKDLPLIVHDINETKARIIIPLLLIPLSFTGPLFFITVALMMAGIYMRKASKLVIYIALILTIASPFLLRLSDMFYSASTPKLRAIAYVNEGRDNMYGIEILKGREDFESRFSYALALKREGRLNDAIAIYKDMLEKNPEARVQTNLGNAYVAASNYAAAKSTYKKALDMEQHPTVLYNLSQVYRALLDSETGDKYYDDAAKLDEAMVSEFTAIAGTHPNRFVIDRTLTNSELWEIATGGAKKVTNISHLPSKTAAAVGVVLLILFVIIDKMTISRAFKCSDCGKVICHYCTENKKWGARCRDCHTQFKEDTSPQARVRRMLKGNEQRDKVRNIVRILSFAPPGIAHVYSGKALTGLLLLWPTLFCILALVINPLFSTGLSVFSHGFLTLPLVVLLSCLYVLKTLGVNSRLESGWL